MPTPSNPTPAEIAAEIDDLERRIAKEVMGKKLWRYDKSGPWMFWSDSDRPVAVGFDWSPWHCPGDALEVLERLANGGPYWIQRIHPGEFEVGLGFGSDESDDWEDAPGDHYGPAVCRLAKKVMGKK